MWVRRGSSGRAVFYRARYYDPAGGRFISEDPIGFNAGDQNLYNYVFNNPVNLTDPDGQFVIVAAGAVVIGGAAAFDFAVGFVLGSAVINAAQNALQSSSGSGAGVPSTFERSRGRGKQNVIETDLENMTPKQLQDALNDARKRGDKKAQQKIRRTQKGKGERGSRQSNDDKTQCK